MPAPNVRQVRPFDYYQSDSRACTILVPYAKHRPHCHVQTRFVIDYASWQLMANDTPGVAVLVVRIKETSGRANSGPRVSLDWLDLLDLLGSLSVCDYVNEITLWERSSSVTALAIVLNSSAVLREFGIVSDSKDPVMSHWATLCKRNRFESFAN